MWLQRFFEASQRSLSYVEHLVTIYKYHDILEIKPTFNLEPEVGTHYENCLIFQLIKGHF